MWKVILFEGTSVKGHICLPGEESFIIADISRRYGAEVKEIKEAEFASIDPGGMVFLDWKPLLLEFEGNHIQIRKEHVDGALILIKNAKPYGDYLTKIYSAYFVVVVPNEWMDEFERKIMAAYDEYKPDLDKKKSELADIPNLVVL